MNQVESVSPKVQPSTSSIPWRDFTLLIALGVIWTIFAAMRPEFLSARNLSMLVIELSITAVLALGMLLIILPGHIDLSAGSGVGLIGGIASVLVFQYQFPAPLALLIGLVVGILLWVLMGKLIVSQRIPAFIITLGGLLIFKGAFWMVIQNKTIPVVEGGRSNLYSILTTWYMPVWGGAALGVLVCAAIIWLQVQAWKKRHRLGLTVESGEILALRLFVITQCIGLFILVTNEYRGIPLPALILGAVTVWIYVLTEHTRFGRHLFAIGGNEEAAKFSGIPIEKVTLTAFGIMGALVAVTGSLQTAYAGASTTTVGELMELDAIAASVIGGTSLKGGRGSVLGVLIGALIMTSLMNGMTLLAVSPELKFIMRGAVLTLAVWLDMAFSKKSS